ncbi:MAG TPA: hypothetical protein VFU89_00595 [Rhabdochlamydiaceae bacterium]|nr:hypothetical protein [Rhabdochlamydiaceae bacterium]
MLLETNSFQIKEPAYFHRDYKNDLKIDDSKKIDDPINQGLRIAGVALPLIALYKPAASALFVVVGSCRAILNISKIYHAYFEDKGRLKIAEQLLHTYLTIASLSCAFFALPLGMLVTTCHDLAMNYIQLYQAWNEKNPAKARETGLQILKNALYLKLFFTASLSILVASIALQILAILVQIPGEFQQGHYLEVGAGLLMVAMRINQAVASV